MSRLAVIGIGEDGWPGLGSRAREALRAAERVLGAERQLALLPAGIVSAEREAWPSPMMPRVEALAAAVAAGDADVRGTVVIGSGDPMLHGIGATLARLVDPARLEVVPAPSAYSLACARLGWPQHEVPLVSLVADPHHDPLPALAGGRAIVYVPGPAGARRLAALLRTAGLGDARLTILARLGGRAESELRTTAAAFDEDAEPLHLVAVDVRGLLTGAGAGAGVGGAARASLAEAGGVARGSALAPDARAATGVGSAAGDEAVAGARIAAGDEIAVGGQRAAGGRVAARGRIAVGAALAPDAGDVSDEAWAPAAVAAVSGADGALRGGAGESAVAPEVVASPVVSSAHDRRLMSPVPGLPDAMYGGDGQLTRADVRAVALAALAPAPGELLWDVGAGSGTIAIEWCRGASRARAIAIERREDRCATIAQNARALEAARVVVVPGDVPEALDGLPAPHAIFLGGATSQPGLVDRCWDALLPGGRLVGAAVTLESERALIEAQTRYGGRLLRLQHDHADALGGFTAWKPQRPIVQWSATKGAEARVGPAPDHAPIPERGTP